MNTYIDERGPYILEMVSNADLRRRSSWANYWAELLQPAQDGKASWGTEGVAVEFHPHTGEGEPRP